ncbi:MAG TPA: cation:proton antiporter [Roseiflexaceae bacterium]|nr:cation:proton antiporter [Roseiflexaceae bacterium]HMP40789.1 cation:proton antiporter [Roseiflexaceae bacterium]
MSDFLQLILVLAIIISASKLAGLVSSRLGQPAVLGELLAGVLLGPSLLNLLHLPIFTSTHLEETVLELAELGVIMLMFIAGLEIEVDELLRAGKIATFAGTLGVVTPLLLGAGLALGFGYGWETAIFIGILMAATSVSISAQTLIELNKLRTRVGVALLGAAVFDDVLVILVLSLFIAFAAGVGGVGDIIFTIVRIGLFIAVALFVGLRFIPWLTSRVARWPISQPVLTTAIVSTLLLAWSAEYIGTVAAITGAFLSGILFGRTTQHEEVSRGVQGIAYGFLVPIFFVSIGLRTNAGLLASGVLLFTVLICIAAVISKVVGCGIGARAGGLSNRESLQLGIGMMSRGEVGLIVATVGISAGVIGEEIFAVTVVMVLVTTLLTPILLRLAFRERPRPVAEQPAKT